MIDILSSVLGLLVGFLIGFIFVLIIKRLKRKKHFTNLKEKVEESYRHLLEAAKIQQEIYKIFNEISEDVKWY